MCVCVFMCVRMSHSLMRVCIHVYVYSCVFMCVRMSHSFMCVCMSVHERTACAIDMRVQTLDRSEYPQSVNVLLLCCSCAANVLLMC